VATRILLVGVARSSAARAEKLASLDELAALTRTSGGTVVERVLQVRPKPEPATFIGRGMVDQLRQLCATYAINLLIFDEELTPSQLRNLEDLIQVRVIDRAAVILDIFAIHARTAEAKAQVELAQLEYRRTRLTGLGRLLSRLGGGIGTRGPGETKLEVSRRRIEQRIAVLKRELARIDRERQVQRGGRSETVRFAIAGYTNAGKSTLFNYLTGASAKVSDQLFATLDANTKPLNLGQNVRVLLTDTVGFIRNLPPQLVASFRATLAELKEADLILHVADASDEQVDSRIDVVNETLAQIGASAIPMQLVFSKVDRVFDAAVTGRLRRRYSGAVFVSGLTGEGIDQLAAVLARFVQRRMVVRTFTIPEQRPDLVSRLYDVGQVLTAAELAGRRRFRVRGFPAALARIRKELSAARIGSFNPKRDDQSRGTIPRP